MRLSLKRTAVVIVAAVVASMGMTGSAQAIDGVDCGDRQDFLKVTLSDGSARCYANAGSFSYGAWAVSISSGNNDIVWRADGVRHYLPRWHYLHWPNAGSVYLTGIQIH